MIFTLALLSRYSGLVISFRQLSRSRISPCEQVGEHHGGAGGCLASGDSGGIRAGATDGGSEVGAVVAQPLASSIGTSSTSTRNRSFFMTMGSCLLLRLGALMFLLTGTTLTEHLGKTVAAIALGRGLASLRTLYTPAVLVGAPVAGHQDYGNRQANPGAHARARLMPSSISVDGYGLVPFSCMMMPTTSSRRICGLEMSIESRTPTPRRLAMACA